MIGELCSSIVIPSQESGVRPKKKGPLSPFLLPSAAGQHEGACIMQTGHWLQGWCLLSSSARSRGQLSSLILLSLGLLGTVLGEAGDAQNAECPVSDDASGMATGEKGLQLIKAGLVAGAASCFWRAADRASSEQEAVGWLKNAAQASEQLNEMEDAVEAWQQMFDTQLSIGLTPELDQMVRVPPLLIQLNRQQQAVNAWGQVVEAHPNSAEVKANYAVTLQQLGLFAEAVSFYQQALDLNANLEPVYSNMAMALREIGEEQRAGEIMKKLEQRRAASSATHTQTYGDLQEIGLDQVRASALHISLYVFRLYHIRLCASLF